jgi:hypothetical protein
MDLDEYRLREQLACHFSIAVKWPFADSFNKQRRCTVTCLYRDQGFKSIALFSFAAYASFYAFLIYILRRPITDTRCGN